MNRLLCLFFSLVCLFDSIYSLSDWIVFNHKHYGTEGYCGNDCLRTKSFIKAYESDDDLNMNNCRTKRHLVDKKYLLWAKACFYADSYTSTLAVEFEIPDLTCCEIEISKWISYLSPSSLITHLSIPGTHDSCTFTVNKLNKFYKCQSKSLYEQFQLGIRYFDVRCRHIYNKFAINHADLYLDMHFEDVVEQLKSLLAQNPSEFIIVSIQEEYKEKYCDRSFSETLKFYIEQYNSSFYVFNPIIDPMPTINQVQGKIVLFHKNFHVSSYNKKKFELVGANSTIFIQDWCCKPGLVRNISKSQLTNII
jgi:hypothetical protein